MKRYRIPEAAAYEIDFTIVPFWVQIHGMPLGTMTTTNAAKIMSKMGEVLEVENPLVEGQLLITFLRVRINVDITKPLDVGYQEMISQKHGWSLNMRNLRIYVTIVGL